jgi:hypothetical protein
MNFGSESSFTLPFSLSITLTLLTLHHRNHFANSSRVKHSTLSRHSMGFFRLYVKFTCIYMVAYCCVRMRRKSVEIFNSFHHFHHNIKSCINIRIWFFTLLHAKEQSFPFFHNIHSTLLNFVFILLSLMSAIPPLFVVEADCMLFFEYNCY